MDNKGTPIAGPLVAGVVVGAAGWVTVGPLPGLMLGLVTIVLLVVLRLARRTA